MGVVRLELLEKKKTFWFVRTRNTNERRWHEQWTMREILQETWGRYNRKFDSYCHMQARLLWNKERCGESLSLEVFKCHLQSFHGNNDFGQKAPWPLRLSSPWWRTLESSLTWASLARRTCEQTPHLRRRWRRLWLYSLHFGSMWISSLTTCCFLKNAALNVQIAQSTCFLVILV